MTNTMKKILLLIAIITALLVKIYIIGNTYNENGNMIMKFLNSSNKPTPIPEHVIELNIVKSQLINANSNVEQLRVELASRNAEINRSKKIRDSTIKVLNANIGGKLSKKGSVIYDACLKYNLNPVLQTSIAMHETGYGESTNSALHSHNNVGGVFNGSHLKHYKNVDDSIYDMAKILREHYIDKGLLNLTAIGKKYCPVGAKNDPTGLNKYWIPSVSKHYNKLTTEIEEELLK